MSKVQTVLIPRSKFTMLRAVNWLKKHGYKYLKVDVTKNYYRFRQKTPKNGILYYSYKLPNGVIIVLHN
jgi:hypothetical protein